MAAKRSSSCRVRRLRSESVCATPSGGPEPPSAAAPSPTDVCPCKPPICCSRWSPAPAPVMLLRSMPSVLGTRLRFLVLGARVNPRELGARVSVAGDSAASPCCCCWCCCCGGVGWSITTCSGSWSAASREEPSRPPAAAAMELKTLVVAPSSFAVASAAPGAPNADKIAAGDEGTAVG